MHKRIKKILNTSNVAFSERLHREMPVAILSPFDFAAALGYDIARITKTLFMSAVDDDNFFLVVLSSNSRVDMTELSSSIGIKRTRMASREELSEILDYPPTGVSPIGARDFPVLLDQSLMRYSTILVGSGEVGAEIEIAPEDLRRITEARVLSLAI